MSTIEHTWKIVVCLAVHNRRPLTLRCLESLRTQIVDRFPFSWRAIVVDDGSTDGTGEAVAAQFPEARLIAGDGSLYWAGGMRRATQVALEEGADFVLWLNDDTILVRDALATLLSCYFSLADSRDAIVVGATCDEHSGVTTYGGLNRTSSWHPLRFRRVDPADEPVPVQTMNGNCVLLPARVQARLGGLEKSFTHSYADIDFGLRASAARIPIWLAAGYIGYCARNSPGTGWDDASLSLGLRLKRILGVKGLPAREQWLFARRHAGILAPIVFALPYVRAITRPAKRLPKPE